MVVTLVLARTTSGMIEASATRHGFRNGETLIEITHDSDPIAHALFHRASGGNVLGKIRVTQAQFDGGEVAVRHELFRLVGCRGRWEGSVSQAVASR